MAKWTSSVDITKDLDCLSEMTCGKRVKTTSPIFKPVGRGRALGVVESEQMEMMDPFEYEMNGYRHSPALQQHFMGIGRGEIIDKMWRSFHKEKDQDLQNQLRAACGAGYSNQLIESAFQEESTSSEDEGQFDDKEETKDTSAELANDIANSSSDKSTVPSIEDAGTQNTLPAATGTSCSPDLPSAGNSNTPPKQPSPKPVQRKPRKYANALMDNLLKRRNEDSILETTNLNPEAEPYCPTPVGSSSSSQTDDSYLNPEAQPFECLVSVQTGSSNATVDISPSIQRTSNRTTPRKLAFNYTVRPSNHPSNGFHELISYDNRPVHHATDFCAPLYDPLPVHNFEYRSEDFPPLS